MFLGVVYVAYGLAILACCLILGWIVVRYGPVGVAVVRERIASDREGAAAMRELAAAMRDLTHEVREDREGVSGQLRQILRRVDLLVARSSGSTASTAPPSIGVDR